MNSWLAGSGAQAGALSGNPVATACGLAALKIAPRLFDALSAHARSPTVQWPPPRRRRTLATDCEGGMFGSSSGRAAAGPDAGDGPPTKARFNRFFTPC